MSVEDTNVTIAQDHDFARRWSTRRCMRQ